MGGGPAPEGRFCASYQTLDARERRKSTSRRFRKIAVLWRFAIDARRLHEEVVGGLFSILGRLDRRLNYLTSGLDKRQARRGPARDDRGLTRRAGRRFQDGKKPLMVLAAFYLEPHCVSTSSILDVARVNDSLRRPRATSRKDL